MRGIPLQWRMLLLYSCTVSCVEAVEWKSYLQWDALAYSETVTLSALLDNWQGENRGGERALMQSRAEIGAVAEDWQVGLLHRYHSQLHFTPETADYYYRQQNGLLNDPTQTYHLDLSGQFFQADGVTLSWTTAVAEGVELKLTGDYLEGRDFRTIDLHASGSLAALENWRSIEDLQFQETYRFRDGLLERFGVPERESADGKGYSLGARLGWKGEHWNGYLAIDDLFGKIYWKQALITTLYMESGTHGTWFPAFPDSGRSTSTVLRLPQQKRAGVSYQVTPHWVGSIDLHALAGHEFYRYSLAWEPSQQFSVQWQALPKQEAVGVALNMPWMQLSLTTDDAQLKQARFLSVAAQVEVEW